MLFERKTHARQLTKIDFGDECQHPKSSGILKQNMVKHYKYLKQKINGKSKSKKVSVRFKPISNFYNIENSKLSQNRSKTPGLFFCDELDMCQNGAIGPSKIWKASNLEDEFLKNEMFPFKSDQHLPGDRLFSKNDFHVQQTNSYQSTLESKNLLVPSAYNSLSRGMLSNGSQNWLVNTMNKIDLSLLNLTPTSPQQFYAEPSWTNKSKNLVYSDSESIKCISDYLNMINDEPAHQEILQNSENACSDQCIRLIYEDSLHSQEDCLSFEVNTIHPSESLYSTNTNVTPDFLISDESSNYNHIHEINSNFSSISGRSIENLIEQIFDIPLVDSNPRNISSIYFEMTIDILETTSSSDGKIA